MMIRASLDPISYRKYGKGSVAIAHLTTERVSIPHRALICERMKYSFRQIRTSVGSADPGHSGVWSSGSGAALRLPVARSAIYG
jgi:hypothetical protein